MAQKSTRRAKARNLSRAANQPSDNVRIFGDDSVCASVAI
jgi:hypothetical protein